RAGAARAGRPAARPRGRSRSPPRRPWRSAATTRAPRRHTGPARRGPAACAGPARRSDGTNWPAPRSRPRSTRSAGGPRPRLPPAPGQGVDRTDPTGLRLAHVRGPPVAQAVPLHARRLPAAALARHHDPPAEAVAQTRPQAALPAVADVLVRHHRQLQPVGLAVRRRAAGPEPRHGLFELPPPVGLPARGPRRGGSGVQHERRRVLAPEPDGARAGAQLGPRPALGGAL